MSEAIFAHTAAIPWTDNQPFFRSSSLPSLWLGNQSLGLACALSEVYKSVLRAWPAPYCTQSMQKTPQTKVTGNGLGLTFLLHTPWPSEPLSSKPRGRLMPAVLLKNFLSLISGLYSSKCEVTESSRGPRWWICGASLIGVLGVFTDCLGIRRLRTINFVWLLCKSLSSVLIGCKKGTQVARIFEDIGRNLPHSLVIGQSTDPSANRWVFECWRGCSCVLVHTCNPSTQEVEQEVV